MTDFNQIRSGATGKRETFEELVCQLAKRFPPANAVEFRRIFGAGGDGGIEAYWRLQDGTEIGYQAKFYTQSRQVDWASIDQSIATALKTHPNLKEVYVALACDLTDAVEGKRGRGRPSKAGWEQWNDHCQSWVVAAQNNGQAVEFKHWTASEIADLLTKPEAIGLNEYWFEKIDLTTEWYSQKFSRTVDALEERYHPEDHVNVSTKAVFDGLLRNDNLMSSLRSALGEVTNSIGIERYAKLLSPSGAELLEQLNSTLEEFAEQKVSTKISVDMQFPTKEWSDTCEAISRSIGDITQELHEVKVATKSTTRVRRAGVAVPQYSADDAIYAMRQLRSAIDKLWELLRSLQKLADDSRFAIIEGRAGSGKSHLLAASVSAGLELGAPCIMLLGTDFAQSADAEQQFKAKLDVTGISFDQFLGAMSASAEAAGQRGLIVIDALNEGIGSALWRNNLSGFVTRVLAYPNLAICVSCRSEYSERLITTSVRQLATVAEVRGFETDDEQENAARVFMDRRGIVRPSTPWLSPEFINPLFLRTTCVSLEKEGRDEFPRGLRGTREVLSFYLTTTARHLHPNYEGSDELKIPVRNAVLALAKAMADGSADFIEYSSAAILIEKCFTGFAAPPASSWLELFRSRGLVRLDPHPEFDFSDPLSTFQDVVRFSFQRFQDHLIVQSIMDGLDSPDDIFGRAGRFNFILDEHYIRWNWHGVFYALTTQAADKFNIELTDYLPGGEAEWWDNYPTSDAFAESVRWRGLTSFSDRTLELANKLRSSDELINLFIELSVVQDHPWNAAFLHPNLFRMALTKRDEFWSQSINYATGEQRHPANRLIDWATHTGITRASDATLRLSLIALVWLFTSSSPELRDRATKAASTILEERPPLFLDTLKMFKECNDLYVIERLLAAAFATVCRNPNGRFVVDYAETVFDTYFGEGCPPTHILLRDYGRAIIEIGAQNFALAARVDAKKYLPPYSSKPPRLTVQQSKLEARAKRVGAETILSSCYSGLSDFGRQDVASRVDDFADALLTGPRPLTSEEARDKFREEMKGRPLVESALMAVEWAYDQKRPVFDTVTMTMNVSQEDVAKVTKSENDARSVLTKAEYTRFKREFLPYCRNRSDWIIPGKLHSNHISEKGAQLWVANRAISFGWTHNLFPYDRSRGEDRLAATRIERIGKKYQWLALHELLARLADNYWLAPDWGRGSKIYDTPVDIDFIRNIEPTILPKDTFEDLDAENLPIVPVLTTDEVELDKLEEWVRDQSVARSRLDLAVGSDLKNSDWVTLYRYASSDVEYEENNSFLESKWKQSEFHFISALFVEPAERNRLVKFAKEVTLDFHDWLPGDTTDGPFVGELGVRDVWQEPMWSELESRTSKRATFKAARPVTGYRWEGHLDGAMPNGADFYLPTPWLLRLLNLSPMPKRPGIFIDGNGVVTIIARSRGRNSSCLMRKDALEKLLKDLQLDCVWTMIGERMGWPNGTRTYSGYANRYNGAAWNHNGQLKKSVWNKYRGLSD